LLWIDLSDEALFLLLSFFLLLDELLPQIENLGEPELVFAAL